MGKNKPKICKSADSASSMSRRYIALALSGAAIAVTIAVNVARARSTQPPATADPTSGKATTTQAPSKHLSWSLEPNGGGEPTPLLVGSWRSQLHGSYPEAWRVRLFSEAGDEVLWSERGGKSSDSTAVAAVPAHSRLFAVIDDYPFMWSLTPDVRSVDVGPEADGAVDAERRQLDRPRVGEARDDGAHGDDGAHDVAQAGGRRRIVELRVVSESPRVLVADNVLSEAECNAVQAAGLPLLETSVTFVGGRMIDDKSAVDKALQPRTSSTAWINSSWLGAIDEQTGRLVRSAQRRLSRLARLPLMGTENLQVSSAC